VRTPRVHWIEAELDPCDALLVAFDELVESLDVVGAHVTAC